MLKKKQREYVLPGVNKRYVTMVQKRMLRNGVDATLKELGSNICSIDQEDSFFDCNPVFGDGLVKGNEYRL